MWDKHMPHTHKKDFHPKPLSFAKMFFFDVSKNLIITQQRFEKTIWNADFYLKIFQRVRFLKKNYMSDFEIKILQPVTF